MLRNRRDGQEAAGETVRAGKKKAVDSASSPDAATAPENNVNRVQEAKPSSWTSVTAAVISFIAKLFLVIIFVPPFLNYASLQREGDMLLPKGAQSIDIGLGQKIHLMCKGDGQPVVILDSPTGMSSDVWFHVQERLSLITKVCTYDRVGLGFSRRVLQNETTDEDKLWGESTTGRMVDYLHQLVEAAEIATPFILVGSELGTFNGRFYSHVHDTEVSDLVLIDPIPEGVFEEEQWQQYWYTHLVPSLQVMQFSAATGLSRILIILGLMKPTMRGEDVSEELLQRQKYLLSNPAHQSSAVEEHFFLNVSAFQVREMSKCKPLSGKISVSVITGDSFDEQLPAHLNEAVAEYQAKFLELSYPKAKRIVIHGADRTMIYKKHSAVSKHLLELVLRRQSKQQSQ